MLTNISLEEFNRDRAFLPLADSIPQTLIAEYLRAASINAGDANPYSTQRLTGIVEERIRPLGYLKSQLADEFFGEAVDDFSSPGGVLRLLNDIGDVIRIPGGSHYPADTRFIRLDETLVLVVSGLPGPLLASKISINHFLPAIARITREQPKNLPEQSLFSWLGIETLDFQDVASWKFALQRPPYGANADEWQIYDPLLGGAWLNAREAVSNSGVFLCRFRPEGVASYQRGIGQLKRRENLVVCTHFLELSFQDSGRVVHGLHLSSGAFQHWRYRVNENWSEIRVSNYTSPELRKLLLTLSERVQSVADTHIKFSISSEVHSELTHILQKFGIKLVSTL